MWSNKRPYLTQAIVRVKGDSFMHVGRAHCEACTLNRSLYRVSGGWGHFLPWGAHGSGSGVRPVLQPREPRSLPQVLSWKSKLPLQTIMRLLQVLVPQVEKICIDK